MCAVLQADRLANRKMPSGSHVKNFKQSPFKFLGEKMWRFEVYSEGKKVEIYKCCAPWGGDSMIGKVRLNYFGT
jgi:(p)ppGpp synthase/HD superfamily hydrolase